MEIALFDCGADRLLVHMIDVAVADLGDRSSVAPAHARCADDPHARHPEPREANRAAIWAPASSHERLSQTRTVIGGGGSSSSASTSKCA